MSKKSDDNLEHFFRKGLKQYDAPFMESDWQKMEKMLDEKAMRDGIIRSKRTRQIAGSVVGALLLVTAVYFAGFHNRQSEETFNQQANQKEHASIIEDLSTNSSTKGKALTDNSSLSDKSVTSDLSEKREETLNRYNAADVKSGNPDSEIHASQQTSILEKSTIRNNVYKSEEMKVDKKIDTSSSTFLANEATVNDGFGVEENVSVNEFNSADNEQINIPDDKVKNEAQAPPIIAASDTDDSSDHIASIEKEDVLLPDSTGETMLKLLEEKQEKISLPSRWSFAFVIAPDFSSAGLGRYTSPGEAYGILVRYLFLRRLSLNAGLLKSNKRYRGTGNDYSPPPGYWDRRTNGVIPDEIYGSCLVYEVPVMLQYDFIQSEKSRMFAGVGLSSYVIANQLYEYSFAEENPGAATDWATSEPATYKFNIGHLSIGYERQLFSKVSVGLEPYLKLPFTGMGWSDVDLCSTGVFLNIRYTISKKVRTE